MTGLVFDDVALDIASDSRGYTVSLAGRAHRVESLASDNAELDLRIDGRRVRAYVSADGQHRWVTVGGRTFVLARSSAARRAAVAHDGSSELSAPMPGLVRAVNVKVGDGVTKGQVLIVLEAMKMEIRLHAPFDGQISSVDAAVGQTVEREQVLVRLQQAPGTTS